MKTLMIIACLLIVGYATNPELKRFLDNMAKCAQELNKPMTEVEVIHCAIRNENLIDEQGRFTLEKCLALADDIIPDEVKRKQAKEIINKCYDELEYKEDNPKINEEQTKKGIQCALPAIALLDTLQ